MNNFYKQTKFDRKFTLEAFADKQIFHVKIDVTQLFIFNDITDPVSKEKFVTLFEELFSENSTSDKDTKINDRSVNIQTNTCIYEIFTKINSADFCKTLLNNVKKIVMELVDKEIPEELISYSNHIFITRVR